MVIINSVIDLVLLNTLIGFPTSLTEFTRARLQQCVTPHNIIFTSVASVRASFPGDMASGNGGRKTAKQIKPSIPPQ